MSTITNKTFQMHNPPHPGGVLRRLYIEPLEISVTEAADRMGVTRKALSELLNGRSGISPQMAIRIGLATETSAESWVNMQTYYDLWQTKKKVGKIKVKPLAA